MQRARHSRWWADRSENTYRAEDRQGNTLFTTVSARLMQPLPPITSTPIFDRNGVPMYSNEPLVGALWNGATLSAQVPGEPQLHYLFTIAQDGKPYAHLIDLSRTGHGSQGEVVAANIPLDGGGPLTYQRGMAVVDDRSGYGPTTLFLLGHSGTQAQLRALSVAAFHADNATPQWHTLETVTATPAILKGRLQPSPDGRRLAYARTTGGTMGLLQWGGNELRVLSLDPGRLALSGAPLTVTGPTGRITGLDFSPAADYLYFTVSGLSYPTTQRLYRLPLAGGPIAPVATAVTDVRRNAQQGGTGMLCATTTGLRRIAQPDDASPTQTTHALPGIQPALALQPVLIGPDRSTSTRHLDRRRYELTDHLGNVRSVVGDRKLSDFSLDINTPVLVPTSFRAQVLSYADYDPFGSLLPGRNYSSGSYRYLFQGQEHDDEINGAVGTSYAYTFRMHEPRIGRFLSIDPLAAKYPQWAPYAFSGNQVIASRELEGLEPNRDLNVGQTVGSYYGTQTPTQGVTEDPDIIKMKADKMVPLGTAQLHGAPLTGMNPHTVNYNDPNEIALMKQTWDNAYANGVLSLFVAGAEALSSLGNLMTSWSTTKALSLPSTPTVPTEIPIARPAAAPNFVVDRSGQVFPVPQGARGPVPVVNSAGNQTGVAFTGGTMGQNGQVSQIRLMNATPPRGASPGYPNGYVVYGNSAGQNVVPSTGRSNAPQSMMHFPLNNPPPPLIIAP